MDLGNIIRWDDSLLEYKVQTPFIGAFLDFQTDATLRLGVDELIKKL